MEQQKQTSGRIVPDRPRRRSWQRPPGGLAGSRVMVDAAGHRRPRSPMRSHRQAVAAAKTAAVILPVVSRRRSEACTYICTRSTVGPVQCGGAVAVLLTSYLGITQVYRQCSAELSPASSCAYSMPLPASMLNRSKLVPCSVTVSRRRPPCRSRVLCPCYCGFLNEQRVHVGHPWARALRGIRVESEFVLDNSRKYAMYETNPAIH